MSAVAAVFAGRTAQGGSIAVTPPPIHLDSIKHEVDDGLAGSVEVVRLVVLPLLLEFGVDDFFLLTAARTPVWRT